MWRLNHIFQQKKKKIKLTSSENSKRAMFLIKEFLLKNEYVNWYYFIEWKKKNEAHCELKRTPNFKALYDENEEIRKRTQEIDNTI